MKETVLNAMLANAGVAALVAARIGWSERVRNSPLPAITLAQVGGAPSITMSGPDGLASPDVQVDCWAENPADADDLASAVKAWAGGVNRVSTAGVLQGVFVTSEHDFFEGEAPERIHRTVLVLRVWFPEP